MGYSHYDKICGVNAVAVGAAGSEVDVIGSTGAITASGDIKTSLGTALAGVVHLAVPITAANTTNYVVAPIAGKVTGYVSYGVSTGTGRAVAVRVGSAGDDLCATGAVGVTALVGSAVAMVASSGGNTVTAGQALSVFMGSCATGQALSMAMITFTPTA